jgi:glycosyltransferase involved in cell wall biosynthesis
VLKGIYPGIGADDKVLLWGGGLYDWLDAPTLIRAVARLADSRPDIKLFFMGVSHPNPQESQRRGTRETLALADELGLTGQAVFFNDWVPYAERENYLLEADIGVSLHRDHLETRFSFRTRFLDCLWAGLPIVATRGDVLGEQVETQGLGRTVEPGDVEGVVEAILSLLETPNLRQAYRYRLEQVAAAYRWEIVTRPLVEFCAAPRIAPDKAHLPQISAFKTGPTPWWRLPGKAWCALRLGGVRGLIRQLGAYRRWVRNRRGKA